MFANGFHMEEKMQDHELRIMPKKELQKMIDSVFIVQDKKSPHLEPYIFPFAFCPICGCSQMRVVNRHVPYPEIWIIGYCKRCGNRVGEADNSRFFHVLEPDD